MRGCSIAPAICCKSGWPTFIALIVREGGRIIPDAVSEVREAIDHCRYDAARLRAEFAAPAELAGPTGERNLLELARPRRLRLHLAVEFSARDLSRPDRRARSPPAMR